jgi:PKD repeat protein
MTAALTTTPITTTTTLFPAPTVLNITPNSGIIGATVNITSLTGANFRTGATVKLVRGTSYITGSTVHAVSASNITCVFVIPSYADAGAWNVTVTNPDGQFGKLINGFTVINSTATTQPTTTATTAPPAPTVSSITPNSGIAGMQVNITNLAGSNLFNVTTVKLTQSGSTDISATNLSVESSTQIKCTFALPSAASGLWNIIVTKSGSQSGIGTGLFTVNPYADFKNATDTPLSGIAPLIISFADISTGSPTTWNWTFGDNNSTEIQNPSHTYAFAGTFTVSLTVTNSGGSDTRTKTGFITVL